MITRQEVEYACDLIEASDGPTPALATIRAYIAQEPARDAAVAWAEAELSYSTALVAAHGLGGKKRGDDAEKALCMRVGKVADDARSAYLALRSMKPSPAPSQPEGK